MSEAPLPTIATAYPSTCTLYRGDCLEVMPTLAQGSVAFCFADLPYAVTNNYWDHFEDLNQFWFALGKLITETSAVVLTASQPFASRLIISNPKLFKYDLVWHKGRPTGFFDAKRKPLRSHEHILVFYAKLPTYNPQKILGGRTYTLQNAGGQSSNYGRSIEGRKKNNTGENYPRSVIAFPCVNNRTILHPTQKPVSLLQWLVATYTKTGDTVLDPVFGSATTALACARLGRNFIGIEKDQSYFQIGVDRVNAERAKLGLSPCEVRT